jgi:Na+/H+ antiporter NhaD/arsenite permease-like protein
LIEIERDQAGTIQPAATAVEHANLISHWTGIAALSCFVLGYVVAMGEERLQVRKSVPVLVAAGLIWVFVGIGYAQIGRSNETLTIGRETLLEFAELLLFLIPAITYVNTLQELGLFDATRIWLTQRGASLRTLFWIVGGIAFVISPWCDNLTTALLVGAVAMAMGAGQPRFVLASCISIVVAANASGAFSPFGDITTLMVWQAGKVQFVEFFALALPSAVNWLIPALVLSATIPREKPSGSGLKAKFDPGAFVVLGMFAATLALTVTIHGVLELPAALGMMMGLACLKAYSYAYNRQPRVLASTWSLDIFGLLAKIEWDTLMFFYGVILGVGGLGALGYLAAASQLLYGALGATTANILVGLISALIDNVPVMFAVLQMSPDMSHGQWLLVTLTAGVGGSLLSIGSAAGVGLMGQARGIYTFGAHLKWMWAVALGYVGGIVTHFVVNAHLF